MRSSSKLTVGLAILATLTVVDSALGYYNPSTGRFIGRDPIAEPGSIVIRQVAARGFIARDPIDDQSNMYRYVRNAPTMRIDPFGLTSDSVWTKCKKDCASTNGLNPDDWKGQQDAYDKGGGFRTCVDGCVKKYPDPEGQCDDGDMAVECWVDYSGLSITCHLGDDWVSCTIVCPSEKDYKKPQGHGPTPPGTYKIGRYRTNKGAANPLTSDPNDTGCPWYNLCPYSGSGCRFRTYEEGHKDYKRTHMGLHPGGTSWGCVTVKPDCWDKLNALVERGKAKQSGGYGRLVVTDAVPQ